ncbi:hypothetical protein [Polyangium jinanense]|uniref:Uncharacterized protein n=1 Tax=Polyangium jinanense TaxID=2829994 RepID=A0A9X4APY8_9BACT|nr:hypothetical protein [Polyangium jinanense]MDC3952910.1 hypothetical protein [Polyangium jinanense]MDC3980528.1 hypothetical protein [Polyangium jinanense]
MEELAALGPPAKPADRERVAKALALVREESDDRDLKFIAGVLRVLV